MGSCCYIKKSIVPTLEPNVLLIPFLVDAGYAAFNLTACNCMLGEAI